MPEQDYEAKFRATVAEWRQKHGLKENDAVLLLVELFKIHQAHWDELRCQHPPGRDELSATILLLAKIEGRLALVMEELGATLALRRLRQAALKRWVAATAVLLGAIGGYFYGRLTQ